MLEYCFENNIILCRLPSHTSHKLQPCDVAVFGPLKNAYRDQVDRLERAGTNTIGKEHFTSLYSHARQTALTKKNILAGFAKCGLQPFNPDRVLKDIPKPPIEPNVAKAVEVRSCMQDEVPQTPVTPMSPSAVMSLHNFIIQKQAHAPDKTSNQSLERYVRKLTKAAQTFFTQCVLQRNQIQFLTKMNDESKVRRSTKLEVLGKAKVMSYEDLKDEREKRAKKVAAKKAKQDAEKEATKDAKGKGKRGPKPKKTTSAEEASADERTRGRKRTDPPEASSPEPKAKKVRISEVSEPWKAPVARMSEMQDMEIELN